VPAKAITMERAKPVLSPTATPLLVPKCLACLNFWSYLQQIRTSNT